MTLNEAATFIANQLGINLSTGSMTTNVYAWLNRTYRNMAGYYNWSWLRSNKDIPVYPDQTGTGASITNGSTTVTFDVTGPVAPFLYDNNINDWYIQLTGDDDWYRFSYDAGNSTTSIEIDIAYPKTALSSVAWKVRKMYYALPSDVAYANSAKQANSKRDIHIVDSTKLDTYVPFDDSTGPVNTIVFWGYDADGNWQFTPYPFPDEIMSLSFRTIKKVSTDLTASDTPIFPDRMTDLWLEGAKAYAYEFLDDDREPKARKRFEEGLKMEKSKDSVGLMQERILGSIEEQPSINNIIPFPPEFGRIR